MKIHHTEIYQILTIKYLVEKWSSNTTHRYVSNLVINLFINANKNTNVMTSYWKTGSVIPAHALL